MLIVDNCNIGVTPNQDILRAVTDAWKTALSSSSVLSPTNTATSCITTFVIGCSSHAVRTRFVHFAGLFSHPTRFHVFSASATFTHAFP